MTSHVQNYAVNVGTKSPLHIIHKHRPAYQLTTAFSSSWCSAGIEMVYRANGPDWAAGPSR